MGLVLRHRARLGGLERVQALTRRDRGLRRRHLRRMSRSTRDSRSCEASPRRSAPVLVAGLPRACAVAFWSLARTASASMLFVDRQRCAGSPTVRSSSVYRTPPDSEEVDGRAKRRFFGPQHLISVSELVFHDTDHDRSGRELQPVCRRLRVELQPCDGSRFEP